MKNLITILLLATGYLVIAQTPAPPPPALGGESTVVVQASKGPLVQTKETVRLSSLDVFQVKSPAGDYIDTQCSVPYSVVRVDHPVTIIPYRELNIFTKLEDLSLLALYQNQADIAAVKARLAAKSKPGATDTLKMDYPFTRSVLFAEEGVVVNPEFLPLPLTDDSDVPEEDTSQLLAIYEVLLVNPLTKECRPDQATNFFFDDELSVLIKYLDEMLRFYQSDLEEIFVEQLPAAKANRWKEGMPLNEKDLQLALSDLSQQQLSPQWQESMRIYADSIEKLSVPFAEQNARFQEKYESLDTLLTSAAEEALFTWVATYCGKTSSVLNSLTTYLRQLTALPTEQTNHAQVFLLAELVELSYQHVNYVCLESVVYAFPALNRINSDYLESITAEVQAFRE